MTCVGVAAGHPGQQLVVGWPVGIGRVLQAGDQRLDRADVGAQAAQARHDRRRHHGLADPGVGAGDKASAQLGAHGGRQRAVVRGGTTRRGEPARAPRSQRRRVPPTSRADVREGGRSALHSSAPTGASAGAGSVTRRRRAPRRDPERARDRGQGARGLDELLLAVGGHHGQPQPRGHRGDRRRADRLREHAARQGGLAHAHGELGIADDQRHDLSARVTDVKALADQPGAQGGGVGGELVHPAGLLLQQVESRESSGHRRGRQCGREDEGARGVEQVARHLVIAGDEGAVGAERLAQRPDDHVDLILEPGLGEGAAAAGAERARAVGVVDDRAQAVALGELDDLGQRGDVAVHREHAVGDDQGAPALGLADAPPEVLHVAVVIDEHLRAREPAAVDERSVVELIGEDHVAGTRQRGDGAGVGQVPRSEQQGALATRERGQAILQPAMDGHRARDISRDAPAPTPQRMAASAAASRTRG